jgi:hypothetical protein
MENYKTIYYLQIDQMLEMHASRRAIVWNFLTNTIKCFYIYKINAIYF